MALSDACAILRLLRVPARGQTGVDDAGQRVDPDPVDGQFPGGRPGQRLLKSFFEQVPRSLEEAAMVDGASRMEVLRHVTVPVAMPAVFTTSRYASYGRAACPSPCRRTCTCLGI